MRGFARFASFLPFDFFEFFSVLLSLSFGFSILAEASLPKILPGCIGRQGQTIPVIEDNQLNTYAAALYHPRYGPLIAISPKRASDFSPLFNTFTYLHECGHHTLAHVEPSWAEVQQHTRLLTKNLEVEADCWGIQEMVRLGYVRKGEDLANVGKYIVTWKADPSHPSGEDRFRGMIQCLKSTLAGRLVVTQTKFQ
jgi:hypothetical protein